MKKIIFLGLISFLLAALWLLPLPIAKPYLEKMIPGLSMGETNGTLWEGQANNLTINKINLEQVSWKVAPLKSLSTLALKSSFTIKGDKINANGMAGLRPDRSLLLDNTQLEISTDLINQQQRRVKLAGDIQASIKHARIKHPLLPVIDGEVDWKNGAINSPVKLPAGDYHTVITPTDTGLLMDLSAKDAPMELKGNITLNNEWQYKTNLSIQPKDKGLGSMLGLVGKKQANGNILIQQRGDLSPFINGVTPKGK